MTNYVGKKYNRPMMYVIENYKQKDLKYHVDLPNNTTRKEMLIYEVDIKFIAIKNNKNDDKLEKRCSIILGQYTRAM